MDQLSPAPWQSCVINGEVCVCVAALGFSTGVSIVKCYSAGFCWEGGNKYGDEERAVELANARFIALARNAFAVMMERGWGWERTAEGWALLDSGGKGWLWVGGHRWFGNNPYEAAERMLEADKWIREQEAKSSVSPT